MTSLVAYASDSDGEQETSVRSSEGGGPPPHPAPSGLALPAPKGRMAKRQIHVDLTLEPAEAPEPPAAPKRPRMNVPSGSHALLGMLPSPQAKAPAPRPKEVVMHSENTVDDDARLTIRDDAQPAEVRGNADFRAMLGLAPKPSSARVPNPAPVILSEPTPAPHPNPEPIPHDTRPVQSTGFFTPGVQEEAHPSTSALRTPAVPISIAPDVADKQAEEPAPTTDWAAQYPGWRCDPDGSWYPVTPEAHAAYAAWAEQAEAEAAAQQALQSKSDAPPAMDAMPVFDAGQALRDAGRTRPPPPTNKKPKVDWQVSEKLQSDRLTNFRARNRGQLSSLLAHAQETRDELEERWAQGKVKRRANSKRYGF